MTLLSVFQTKKLRPYRALLFAVLGLWGIVPAVHSFAIHRHEMPMRYALTHTVSMGAVYLVRPSSRLPPLCQACSLGQLHLRAACRRVQPCAACLRVLSSAPDCQELRAALTAPSTRPTHACAAKSARAPQLPSLTGCTRCPPQIGAAIYACRVPERWKPGAFDMVAHSHQLFHLSVIAAALVSPWPWRRPLGCTQP